MRALTVEVGGRSCVGPANSEGGRLPPLSGRRPYVSKAGPLREARRPAHPSANSTDKGESTLNACFAEKSLLNWAQATLAKAADVADFERPSVSAPSAGAQIKDIFACAGLVRRGGAALQVGERRIRRSAR
jgi:hypothetical protein